MAQGFRYGALSIWRRPFLVLAPPPGQTFHLLETPFADTSNRDLMIPFKGIRRTKRGDA